MEILATSLAHTAARKSLHNTFISNVKVHNSINLGDIALTRQEKKIMTKEEWEAIKEQGASSKVDADDYRFARA